jgi:CBS-domain-containing membrane protein
MSLFRKFLSANNVIGISIAALAISVVLVGFVWAGTSALERQQSQSPSAVMGISQDEQGSQDTSVPISDGSSNSDFDKSLQELTERLDAAIQDVTDLSQRIIDAEKLSEISDTRITQLNSQVSVISADIQLLRDEITVLKKDLGALDSRIEDLVLLVTKKTSAIDDEGRYVGVIAPSQISPQLRVVDIVGNWPMNRTTGDLNLGRMISDLSWCSADSSNYSVLSVDPFRRLACTRIPK